MSNELHVMPGVTYLDAVDADGVAIRCVARLASVEVVHRERRVTGYLVQTLSVRDGFLHRVLIIEYFVTSNDRLHPARQAQTPKTIVKYLITFQGGGGIIGDFYTGRQPVKNAVPSQYRVTLRRNEHPGLSVPENIVLLQHPLPAVENAYPSVAPVEDLVPLEGRIRIGLYPHPGHRIVEDLILLEQT